MNFSNKRVLARYIKKNLFLSKRGRGVRAPEPFSQSATGWPLVRMTKYGEEAIASALCFSANTS